MQACPGFNRTHKGHLTPTERESVKMRERLNIRFSEAFKEHYNEQKKACSTRRSIAAILAVWTDDPKKEELILGFYDEDKLPPIDEFQKKFYGEDFEFLEGRIMGEMR